MGSIQKKGMLCIVILGMFSFSKGNDLDLREQECRVFKELVTTCKKDLQDCRGAYYLKSKINNQLLANNLSAICYYVCIAEKTGYKKEEVNKEIDSFILQSCKKPSVP